MTALTIAKIHAIRLGTGVYEVPCNGCTKCCHNDAVRILPHEDAGKWKIEPHPWMPLAVMLAHQPNGDCVYLGDHGCMIQHDKPQQCHEMDCRSIARSVTWTQARKLEKRGALRMEIWRRGQELLRQADAALGSER